MSTWTDHRGFQFPMTPRGGSDLLRYTSDPSRRSSSTAISIAFEADPTIVRQFVPDPMEVDGSGLTLLQIIDGTQFGDYNAREFISYDRIHYTQAVIMIPCHYAGERYYFVPLAWSNSYVLATMGRLVGTPYKLADVQLTRFQPADPEYDRPRSGIRLCASIEARGLVCRAQLHLAERVASRDMPYGWAGPHTPKWTSRRYFYDAVKGVPVLDDLVAHWGDEMKVGEVWAGTPSLSFHDAENEEADLFRPNRVIGGWFFSYTFNHKHSAPRVVYDYLDKGRGSHA